MHLSLIPILGKIAWFLKIHPIDLLNPVAQVINSWLHQVSADLEHD